MFNIDNFIQRSIGSIREKKGAALIIALIISLLISMIGVFLIEKLIPASRSVKGIENSNEAYYEALTGLESSLLAMSKDDPGYETGAIIGASTMTGYTYNITATGVQIPSSGEGNSEYDTTKSWNKIGKKSPIQLKLKSSMDWSNVKIIFKVPDLNGNVANTDQSITGSLSNSGIVSWVLYGSGRALMSSGSDILGTDVNSGSSINIATKLGKDLYGTGYSFTQFYGKYLTTSCDAKCTLKFFIINDLTLKNGITAPYLEYQITGFDKPIPSQYATIKSKGYSNGFTIGIEQKNLQLTTDEIVDYTLFSE